MSTDDELNEELGSYGYKLDTFALKDGNYQVSRLDGYGGYTATFKDVQDLRTFLKHLAESDMNRPGESGDFMVRELVLGSVLSVVVDSLHPGGWEWRRSVGDGAVVEPVGPVGSCEFNFVVGAHGPIAGLIGFRRTSLGVCSGTRRCLRGRRRCRRMPR
jgi:hypothetical protein